MRRHRLLPFCALLGVLFAGFLPKLDAQEVLVVGKRDIIFLMDSTMGATLVISVREFIKRFIDSMPIGPDDVQVGVATFGNIPRLEMDLNSHGSTEALTAALFSIKPRPGQSVNIGAALEFVRTQMIAPEKGSRYQQGIPQLLLLLTSKKSNDSVEAPAMELQRMGVLSLAAGSKAADEQELRQIASTDSLVFMLRDFRGLLRPPIPDPIIGALSTLAGVVVTEVPTEPVLAVGKRDIIFLIDSTMGATLINSVREFIRRFVDRMPIGPDNVQVGVATFGNNPRLEMDLNSHGSREALTAALFSIKPRPGQSVNIGAALEFVRTRMIVPEKGSRYQQGTPHLLLLLTSKKSSDSVEAPARELQRMGVVTLAAGSKAADEQELNQIGFTDSLVFMLRDFHGLLRPPIPDPIIGALSTLVGVVVTEVPTEPVLVVGKRDIIFLIDSTMGAMLINSVREFIRRFIDSMPIGPDNVQVGVATFGNIPRLEMDLNSHGSTEALTAALFSIKPRPGQSVNIGAALEFVRTRMIVPEKGSRYQQGTPHLLLLLTSKKSSDSVEAPARELQRMGVVTLAAGSKAADEQELRQIGFTDSLVFMLRDFRGLLHPAIPDPIIGALSTLVGVVVTEVPTEPAVTPAPAQGVKRDVVFLIDGTTAGRSEFPAIRDMIRRVTEKLDIGLDKVRVSVVQYSDEPVSEFLLNEHSTPDELRQAVARLQSRGGNLLNTGHALGWVSRRIYQRSAGSRIEEGVPQFLILVTGGKSSDDVSTSADLLKRSHVAPLAIGSRNADPNELRQISLKPELVFTVDSYQQLPRVETQLIESVKTISTDDIITHVPQVEVSLNLGKKDIIFLIDGSDNTGPEGIAHIRDFILKIVRQLDVQPDQVRVSVVQYSDKVKSEFSLNSHNNKPAVISAIQRLRQMGGRSSDLADAIKYVMQNELIPSAGVRLSEASQHLVVLTGGRSSQDVSMYGPLLNNSRVNCIGVGASGADTRQLGQIATSSEDVLHVPTFPGLSAIRERFITRLSGTMPEETPTHVYDSDLPAAKKAPGDT
ncbi:collagen alpha-3(VI) chain [Limanda limanda]|uniref:collagen alpha-3(VI) chain n=1 Tax=Limanda limanda TaxID=27771 RepID=UPI0029C6D6F3|nr:collagen alpha-3(VI) chain [Limanda limanda]